MTAKISTILRKALTRLPPPSVESLVIKYGPIIDKHALKARIGLGAYSRHQPEDLTRDCLCEIISLEPGLGPAPLSGEWLRKWAERSKNNNAHRLRAEIETRIRGHIQTLEEHRRANEASEVETKGRDLIARYTDIVNKFLDIAERKVSVFDEYGDEQWHRLPREVDACILKIATREGIDESNTRNNLKNDYTFALPAPIAWLRSQLPQIFREHHEQIKNRSINRSDFASLSGIEFETCIARILRDNGFDITATPTTGDQGADLIASKDGRKIIIQTKRYSGTVGNRAVQEVVGAVKFYGGTEGWVITNSTFTPSARALAQKNSIRLIDGNDLRRPNSLASL
jgi:restriction endonuclease Mrr